jgi:hypothetical protein
MHPLLFVNWSSVNVMFRGLMWIVAIVLAGVIVTHLVPASPDVHHTVRLMRWRRGGMAAALLRRRATSRIRDRSDDLIPDDDDAGETLGQGLLARRPERRQVRRRDDEHACPASSPSRQTPVLERVGHCSGAGLRVLRLSAHSALDVGHGCLEALVRAPLPRL